MSSHPSLHTVSAALGEALIERNESVCTAESCTGGGVAAAMTDVPGSSRWFERGFVTYSNAAKEEMLGVLPETLRQHGAVSESVVCEMAAGALSHSHAQWSIAISGIAGPEGGTPDKPVGTVWLAWAGPNRFLSAEKQLFAGNREAVREQASQYAIERLLAFLNNCI